MKTRLLGAFVLIALAVIFIPMFFTGSPPENGSEQSIGLDIPPAPDRELKTRTVDLNPDGPVTSAHAPQAPSGGVVIPSQDTAASGRLPTVDIASRKPQDAGAEQTAPMQPLIPAQKPLQVKAQAVSTPTMAPLAMAAQANYSLNLSAYAASDSVQKLLTQVRALGYPVSTKPIVQSGKSLTLVIAGPFGSRAAAEAARLKISQSISGVPVVVFPGAYDQKGDAPAPAAAPVSAAPKASTSPPAAPVPTSSSALATGYAVQVAAMATQADAHQLRDKIRSAGYDAYVDTVDRDTRRLWRVRVGPQTQRGDAERIRGELQSRLALVGNIVTVP